MQPRAAGAGVEQMRGAMARTNERQEQKKVSFSTNLPQYIRIDNHLSHRLTSLSGCRSSRQMASTLAILPSPQRLQEGSIDERRLNLFERAQRCSRNSSAVNPMSFAICRRSNGEMSRPGWKGTVVPRPSGWRYCRCDPRWRTSTKPRRSRIATTSRGLRIGGLTILSRQRPFGCRRTPHPAWVPHPQGASR